MEIPILAQDAARARAAQQTAGEKREAETIDAVCAFLVYQTAEGAWASTPDLAADIVIERPPTRHDIISGCEAAKQEQIRQMATQEITMNVLGNFTRAMADPQFQLAMLQANETARAAAAAASGR